MIIFPDIIGLVAIHLVSWVAVGHAMLTKKDPRAALGWSVTSIMLPIMGPLLYALFGISRAQSRAERIMRRQVAQAPEYILPPEPTARIFSRGRTQRMASMGRNVTGIPVCGGNRVIPLVNGDEAYPAMLEAIRSARNNVYLATYIFNSGQVSSAFLRELSDARARGVDVRVILDGIGILYSWRKSWKKLLASGVEVRIFLPPRLFPPNFSINLRNHRKVLVCDGIGFTGGMNIADGNILIRGSRKIQDIHFRCEGPVVNQLARSFLLNWGFCAGEYPPLPTVVDRTAGRSHCRVVTDGPGNDADVLNDLICGAINMASRSVRIMTPYFLPSHDLMAALRAAGQRGVDVRLILPARNNLPYVGWASLRLLPGLLSAGMRVWLQPPPFAHTKLLAIDGFYAQVGSANLDARSMRLNFELNMEVFDPEFHNSLIRHMDGVQDRSREITLEQLKAQPLPLRLRNAFCWLFSPYL